VAAGTNFARWLQYIYFLRVSVLSWIFLPLFCLLDLLGVTATLSRGIWPSRDLRILASCARSRELVCRDVRIFPDHQI
jgi:hypothetical protein